ncbi:hypothetical protein [Glycomyces tenuis]|uniref:hypothetical protein n=1 Tax=Glycomyces tenuis TaxID=58116 RepID=UPI0012DC254E|nr:hypothetical protein [Glycomyces tenuis]
MTRKFLCQIGHSSLKNPDGMEKVRGSNPLSSTTLINTASEQAKQVRIRDTFMVVSEQRLMISNRRLSVPYTSVVTQGSKKLSNEAGVAAHQRGSADPGVLLDGVEDDPARSAVDLLADLTAPDALACAGPTGEGDGAGRRPVGLLGGGADVADVDGRALDRSDTGWDRDRTGVAAPPGRGAHT